MHTQSRGDRTTIPSEHAGELVATDFPGQASANITVYNFKFACGATLPKLVLHVTTLGTPHQNVHGKVDNAVLLLHSTSSTGELSFLRTGVGDELFGPGQPLDARKFFVILPDGIGRGGSSKPSDELGSGFPHYGFEDVVAGQHLVVESLGVERLRLVLGLSMGGMHAWMWAERHAHLVEAILPIACLPVAISGRNLLWRRLIREIIQSDPDFQSGPADLTIRFKNLMPIFDIMTRSPVRLQELAETGAEAEQLYDDFTGKYGSFKAHDCLRWFESSFDYDPRPKLDQIKARVLAVNFADDEVNPPELGVLEREMRRVQHGRFVTIPAGPKSNGHLSILQASLWKRHIVELLGVP